LENSFRELLKPQNANLVLFIF